MTQSTSETVKRWVGIGVLILAWLVGTAVQWGAFSSRLAAAEEALKDKVSRTEYQDLKDRLQRIEDKLDRNWKAVRQ